MFFLLCLICIYNFINPMKIEDIEVTSAIKAISKFVLFRILKVDFSYLSIFDCYLVVLSY